MLVAEPYLLISDASLDAAAQARATIEQSIGERSANATGAVQLALIGGFDSRVLLGAAIASGVALRTITYGRPYHAELLIAKEVARAVQAEHTVVPLSATILDDYIDANIRAVEGGSTYILSVVNLLRAPAPDGSLLMHGFLGDALGGAHVSAWTQGASLNTPEEVCYSIVDRIYKGPPHELGALLDMDWRPDAVRQDVLDQLDTTALGYQALMIWDLENRQRRFIANHFRVLGERFDVTIAFYDDAITQLFLSLPRALLDGRLITREILSRHYPRLARIRHAEEHHPILLSLAGYLKGTGLDLVRRVPGLGPRLSRYQNIWLSATAQARRDRHGLVARIEDRFSALRQLLPIRGEHFDAALFARIAPEGLLKLSMLAEYAAAVQARQTPTIASSPLTIDAPSAHQAPPLAVAVRSIPSAPGWPWPPVSGCGRCPRSGPPSRNR